MIFVKDTKNPIMDYKLKEDTLKLNKLMSLIKPRIPIEIDKNEMRQ